ncbi:hypothetical protein KIW84_055376 [Lathyrus oleraceus]|uniref:Uncharacterized protein n=1 Tax=Pisum sativum TaxID=3888 RepID=A0A9D4WXU6_PEA|nr:hypothetical protein KIW84_055376 [Pisum sativum]
MSYQFFFCVSAKLTHHYSTRANRMKRMKHLQQENRELKDEISRLTTLMDQFVPVMPAGFAWGMPPIFVPEGYAQTFASIPASSPVLSVPPPIVYIMPYIKETIYLSKSSEGPDVYEKMDEMKDQFLELCKELKTLRGKDLFGKIVAELCLVPNVKIPVKFKVPNFEKYKGNTCLLSHLVMYARKMSTQTDND